MLLWRLLVLRTTSLPLNRNARSGPFLEIAVASFETVTQKKMGLFAIVFTKNRTTRAPRPSRMGKRFAFYPAATPPIGFHGEGAGVNKPVGAKTSHSGGYDLHSWRYSQCGLSRAGRSQRTGGERCRSQAIRLGAPPAHCRIRELKINPRGSRPVWPALVQWGWKRNGHPIILRPWHSVRQRLTSKLANLSVVGVGMSS